MTDATVASLAEMRAQLAGEIELLQLELRQAIADLDTIEAAIQVFLPDKRGLTVPSGPVPPQHQALRGAVKATILNVLRAARTPVSTDVIALQLLQDRRLPTDDPSLRALFGRRVGAALFHLARRGVARRVGKDGRFTSWALTSIYEDAAD